MRPLERHRYVDGTPWPLPNKDAWELSEFYALSRVNDDLLLPFQGDPDSEVPPSLTQEAYARFFEALGFEPFSERPYSPFHHEIVAVAEAADAVAITVERVVWPGLLFGQLLFSRAGVQIRCPPGTFDVPATEGSTLYWAHRRLRRPTMDLSVGWGTTPSGGPPSAATTRTPSASASTSTGKSTSVARSWPCSDLTRTGGCPVRRGGNSWSTAASWPHPEPPTSRAKPRAGPSPTSTCSRTGTDWRCRRRPRPGRAEARLMEPDVTQARPARIPRPAEFRPPSDDADARINAPRSCGKGPGTSAPAAR
jgi:hypothetical protein